MNQAIIKTTITMAQKDFTESRAQGRPEWVTGIRGRLVTALRSENSVYIKGVLKEARAYEALSGKVQEACWALIQG